MFQDFIMFLARANVHIRRPFVKPHNSDLVMVSKIKLSHINTQKVIVILVSMVHHKRASHNSFCDMAAWRLGISCCFSSMTHTFTHLERERVAGSTFAGSVAAFTMNKGND